MPYTFVFTGPCRDQQKPRPGRPRRDRTKVKAARKAAHRR